MTQRSSPSSIQRTMAWDLIQLNRAHRKAAAACLERLGLHVGQEVLLARLWEEEGQPQAALAGSLCVEPPTITRMVDRMEQAGFVERRRDAEDARVSRVYLTPRGREARAAAQACWTELDARMLDGLSLEERLLLRRLLRAMQANLG